MEKLLELMVLCGCHDMKFSAHPKGRRTPADDNKPGFLYDNKFKITKQCYTDVNGGNCNTKLLNPVFFSVLFFFFI